MQPPVKSNVSTFHARTHYANKSFRHCARKRLDASFSRSARSASSVSVIWRRVRGVRLLAGCTCAHGVVRWRRSRGVAANMRGGRKGKHARLFPLPLARAVRDTRKAYRRRGGERDGTIGAGAGATRTADSRAAGGGRSAEGATRTARRGCAVVGGQLCSSR